MSEETKAQEMMTGEHAAEETVTGQPSDRQEQAETSADLAGVTALKKGDTVRGKIVKVESDQVYVDIGYKYDGIIPLRELSALPAENAAERVEVGQEVELKVITIDDEKEKLILSKRQIDTEKAWEDLQKKLESREIFEAPVVDVVKGGLVVDVGIRGFVPASMVERHFVEDFSDYKGRTLRLRVKELDREKRKVILSQKDVLDEEFEAKKQKILSELNVGQELEGTVQRLTPFGAFVDIGGIDGLVHVSEMAWQRVEHPSDIVNVGDKVKVKVLKVDPEAEKVSLSIKATQKGPWDLVSEQFQVGEITTGTVKRLVSFGAFVEIMPGVEGLVHISQIAHRHIGTPHEVLKEGQQVNVKILEMNPAEKRVSLSIKETENAPEPKGDRQKAGKTQDAEDIPVQNQGLSLTLGERFGDKLSKLK